MQKSFLVYHYYFLSRNYNYCLSLCLVLSWLMVVIFILYVYFYINVLVRCDSKFSLGFTDCNEMRGYMTAKGLIQ